MSEIIQAIGWAVAIIVCYYLVNLSLVLFPTWPRISKGLPPSPLANNLKNGRYSDAVQLALNAIDEARSRFVRIGIYDEEAFDLAVAPILKLLKSDPGRFLKALANHPDPSPRDWVYAMLSNVAADLLESGGYHIYRGLLSAVGMALLTIFEGCDDELIKSGHIDAEYAAEQKRILRKNIKEMG
ncbi:MAG: hypothetical protein P4L43_09540 [Syntrophobacteraceae bacterium]|nr:hypothetical protein [Syntrophobacteraceae bacterium]